MNKYLSLFSDTIIFGIGNFTTRLIYFFLMPIYTLSLSTYDFGIADLLNNSLQLIIPILTLSITDAIFRFSLDKNVARSELLYNGLKVLSWSYILTAIFVGCVAAFNLERYWYAFSILYVTESLKSLFAQFTRGIGKVKEYAINGIIAAIILFAATYVFLKILKWGVNGYLMAFIMANAVSCIYLLFIVGIRKYMDTRQSNRILLKSMIAFSLPLTPNMLSWWITNISSRYIIAFFSGISASGLFAAASKIPALINVFSSIFQLSWQYASVKEYNESSESDFYSVVLKYYTVAIFIFGSIIICTVPNISSFILKGDFYDAWVYSPLLLFSAILGCFSIFFGTFYSVVKENKKVMTTTIFGAVLNIVLCFTLIPLIGIIGALVANVLSYLLIVYLRVKDSLKYFKIDINRRMTALGLLFLLCEAFLMMMPKPFIMIAYIIPLVLIGIYWDIISDTVKFIKKALIKRKNINNG